MLTYHSRIRSGVFVLFRFLRPCALGELAPAEGFAAAMTVVHIAIEIALQQRLLLRAIPHSGEMTLRPKLEAQIPKEGQNPKRSDSLNARSLHTGSSGLESTCRWRPGTVSAAAPRRVGARRSDPIIRPTVFRKNCPKPRGYKPKPPKPHQCDIRATPKPVDRQPIATPKPP